MPRWPIILCQNGFRGWQRAGQGFLHNCRCSWAKKEDPSPKSFAHRNADTWKAFGYHALTGNVHPILTKAEAGYAQSSPSRASSKERKSSNSRAGSPIPPPELHRMHESDNDIFPGLRSAKKSPGSLKRSQRSRRMRMLGKSTSLAPKSTKTSLTGSSKHPRKSHSLSIGKHRIYRPTKSTSSASKPTQKPLARSAKHVHNLPRIRVPKKSPLSSPKPAKKPSDALRVGNHIVSVYQQAQSRDQSQQTSLWRDPPNVGYVVLQRNHLKIRVRQGNLQPQENHYVHLNSRR